MAEKLNIPKVEDFDNRWLFFANVISCVGVIVLHCNNIFWNHPIDNIWKSANLIETLFYWPVPFFFMQTGTTLLDYRKRYSSKVYFTKRVWRVFIPFVFWSIFSYFYKVLYCAWEVEPIKRVINGILSSKYIYAYWFFWPLFLIYLTIPFVSFSISFVDDITKKKLILYGIMIQLILISILPLLSNVYGLHLPSYFTNPIFNEYMLFVFIGYYISHYEIKKKNRFILYVLGVIGFIIHLKGTEMYSLVTGQVYLMYKGYTNLPSVLQSSAFFLLLKEISRKVELLNKDIFLNLARYSFGIYLIHMYFLEQIQVQFSIDTTSIYWRVFAPIIIYCLSLFVCILIDRNGKLRRIIGLKWWFYYNN